MVLAYQMGLNGQTLGVGAEFSGICWLRAGNDSRTRCDGLRLAKIVKTWRIH